MLMVKCEKCGKTFKLEGKECPQISFGRYDYFNWKDVPGEEHDVCEECYNELKSMFSFFTRED